MTQLEHPLVQKWTTTTLPRSSCHGQRLGVDPLLDVPKLGGRCRLARLEELRPGGRGERNRDPHKQAKTLRIGAKRINLTLKWALKASCLIRVLPASTVEGSVRLASVRVDERVADHPLAVDDVWCRGKLARIVAIVLGQVESRERCAGLGIGGEPGAPNRSNRGPRSRRSRPTETKWSSAALGRCSGHCWSWGKRRSRQSRL